MVKFWRTFLISKILINQTRIKIMQIIKFNTWYLLFTLPWNPDFNNTGSIDLLSQINSWQILAYPPIHSFVLHNWQFCMCLLWMCCLRCKDGYKLFKCPSCLLQITEVGSFSTNESTVSDQLTNQKLVWFPSLLCFPPLHWYKHRHGKCWPLSSGYT